MKISKNISKGEQITSLDYLLTLAKEKKSVVVLQFGHYYVRPAAFLVNWPLCMLVRHKIFHALKESNEA